MTAQISPRTARRLLAGFALSASAAVVLASVRAHRGPAEPALLDARPALRLVLDPGARGATGRTPGASVTSSDAPPTGAPDEVTRAQVAEIGLDQRMDRWVRSHAERLEPLLNAAVRRGAHARAMALAELLGWYLGRHPAEVERWVATNRNANVRVVAYLQLSLGLSGTLAGRQVLLDELVDRELPAVRRIGALVALAQESDRARYYRLRPLQLGARQAHRRARVGPIAAPGVRQTLRAVADDDREASTLRVAAIGVLGPSLVHDDMRAAIVRLAADPSPRIRAAALRELGSVAPETVRRAVAEELDGAARRAAVLALDPDDAINRDVLHAQLSQTSDADLRVAILAGLLEGPLTPRTVAAAVEMSTATDPAVAGHAAALLASRERELARAPSRIRSTVQRALVASRRPRAGRLMDGAALAARARLAADLVRVRLRRTNRRAGR